MRALILLVTLNVMGAGLKNEVLDKFAKLKKRTGCSFVISSGYRDRNKNKKVGGSPNSYHLHGEAIDIVIKKCRYSLFKVAKIAHRYFNGVIWYNRHIHLDIRDTPYFGKGTYK